MLTIAVPKGRLGNRVHSLLVEAGFACGALKEAGRRLVLEEPAAGLRFLLVKPADVAAYVEKGAADVGVAGKDVLIETEPDLYEMLDLGFGRCHMAVAAMQGYQENFSRRIRVATKYENIARQYYAKQGRDAQLIHLNGSIELAPVLGMADVIVDIVETGETLRENHLQVLDRFMTISARLIVNKASYRFYQKEIDQVITQIKEVLP